jgi:regulator of nonsense transcripts 1
VRSNFESQIDKSLGFLLDERRLNVAITRPKYFLLVVGNSKTLKKSMIWENMIEFCISHGRYVQVNDRSFFDTMADFKKSVAP